MALPGGAADKAGNRYELAWTISCMLDVYQGDAQSIHIESPFTDDHGAEFVLSRSGATERHQCKLGPQIVARWTLKGLHIAGVLGQFLRFTNSSNQKFIFVSMVGVDILSGLAERAGKAVGYNEFTTVYLEAASWSKAFNDLFTIIQGDNDLRKELAPIVSIAVTALETRETPVDQHDLSEQIKIANEARQREELYDRLKRLEIRTQDEKSLRKDVEKSLQILFDAEPGLTYAALQDLALRSIHISLSAIDISSALESRGIHSTDPAKSKLLFEKVKSVNELMWDRLANLTIGGVSYPRNETAAVTQAAQTAKQGILFVTGGPGVGKSGVLLASAKEFESLGWAVLTIRADLEPFDKAILPQHISTALSLPEHSPATILKRIAGGKPSVLVIDQLDSVSQTYGRRTQVFETIKTVIDDAVSRGVMVILGCRKFDIENDPRIRQLDVRKDRGPIEVSGFSDEVVRNIVTALGAGGKSLSQAQIRLFSVPLHLDMLAKTNPKGSIAIISEKELFGEFWNTKRHRVKSLAPNADWNNILDRVLGGMEESNSLIAPNIVLSDCDPQTVNAFLSEQLILKDIAGYRFFHEKFFDYAFARRFSEKGLELRSLIVTREQNLSLRSRVRQILLFRRSTDRAKYLVDLKWLLNEQSVRLHIKALILELLGQFDGAMIEEWEIIRSLIAADNDTLDLSRPIAAHAWKLLYHEPWFLKAHECGDIQSWLRSTDNNTIGQAINLLHWLEFAIPTDIIDTLEGFVDASQLWNTRVAQVFESRNISKSRDLFEFYLRMIESGILESYFMERSDIRDFWGIMYSVAEEHPEWSCEAIATYLKRGVIVAEENEIAEPFGYSKSVFPHSQMDDSVLDRCVQSAPRAVLTHILPAVQEFMTKFADKDRERPWVDSVWIYRHDFDAFTLSDHILKAVENSLAHLGENDPEELQRLLSTLDPDYETNQFLIIRAYTIAGSALADHAVDFVCGYPDCLKTGYINDYHYAARLLLSAVSPHCSDERLQRLSALILAYYPKREQRYFDKKRGTQRGWSQFNLIEGLAENRRSPAVKQRIEELRRKFINQSPTVPKRIEMQAVESPIPPHSVDKLTDNQWLKAIAKYNADNDRFKERRGRLTGGALELSRQLEAQAKIQPSRFARFAGLLPENTHKYYFSGIVSGIADANTSLDDMILLVERCHALPTRPCGKAICRMIEKKPELSWPESILEIIAWYATDDPDPVIELWRTPAGPDGTPYDGGDILHSGLNCTRGAAAIAITDLLFSDMSRIAFFIPVLEHMVEDPSLAVRSQVAKALGPIWNYDKDLAIDLYLRLCDAEDVLLATHYALDLMPCILHSHFKSLKPLLERMRLSSAPEVQEACGTMSVIAYLSTDDALHLVDDCYIGTAAHRLGLAKAFAANIRMLNLRPKCIDGLQRLFYDADSEVRKAAGACFTRFEGDELGSVESLINAYSESTALLDDSFHILRALEETTAKMPDSSLKVFERFVELHGNQIGDQRYSPAMHANEVSSLVLRLYSQTEDVVTRKRCLDLIDNLIGNQVYGMGRELQDFESQ